MRRHNLTGDALLVGLACMALLGGGCAGPDTLQATSPPSKEDRTLQVMEGSKVTLQYVASVPGPSGIDYSNVTKFVQGRHEISPALEREVVGMKPGEEKKVALSPEEGFGPHDERKKLSIPKRLLPFGTKAGDILRNDAGELMTVAEISDTTAVLDYNHPLAGKPVLVQLKILKVENP